MSLLDVEDLRVTFDIEGRKIPAVRRVSFSIAKGETLALVGESGSGKSVTALSLLRLLPVAPEGRIVFDNSIVTDETALSLRGRRIAMIFQEPMTSLNPLHTIEAQISEVLALHKGLSCADARARAVELLRLVGLPEPEARLASYPHELSGGQRQRVMIAMAMAGEPELLIADEPTTALDVTIQAQILDLLKDIQKKTGMALLMITHDLGLVRQIADRVAVMKEGEIVEQGSAAGLFAAPRHPYTRMLMEAEPKAADRHEKVESPILLRADNIRVRFPVKTGFFLRAKTFVHAVDGISLAISKGETVGVVGESGSGKTTLGLALLRLIESEGAIAFDGRLITNLSRRTMRPLRRNMQIVFQDPFGSLSPRMTVGDIVAEGLDIHEPIRDKTSRRARIEASLDEVGLDPSMADRFPHEFSGGQRQRIAIARAMILNPQLVVLDEPTSALDRSVQAQIVDLLRTLQERHALSYLFISHDLRVVRALADRVIVMKEGRVVETGEASAIFSAPEKAYTRELLSAALL